MANYYYNGVLLPELPEEIQQLQYNVIVINEGGNWLACGCAGKIWNDTTLESGDSTYLNQSAGSLTFSVYNNVTKAWNATRTGNYSTDYAKIIWSNYDIPNGSATGTTIIFPASGEPILAPNLVYSGYAIQADTLTVIADEVRRLCDTEDALTPGQMQEKLAGLNIELQEAYVAPTTEVQIIKPDEGYYGFSSITVEAVEYDDSGGDSGGGSGGGDSGDTEEDTEPMDPAEDFYFDLSVEPETGTSYYTKGPLYSGDAAQTGNRFTATVNRTIYGAMFYACTGGVSGCVLRLWDCSTGEVLTQSEEVYTTAENRWLFIRFPAVQLEIGKDYVLSFGGYGSVWKFQSFGDYTISYAESLSYRYSTNGGMPNNTNNIKPIMLDPVFEAYGAQYADSTFTISYTSLERIANEVKRITGMTSISTVSEIIAALETVPAMT